MTKYILVGGYIHKAPDGGKALFEEMVKGFNFDRPIKILDCTFAEPRELWKEKFQKDKLIFLRYLNNFEFEFADPLKFAEQIKLSDVLHIRGGTVDLLMEVLSKSGNWIKELEGKTVVGTSAGAGVFAKYSYGLNSLKLLDCLGLLPIKFLAHFRSDYNAPNIDWDKALEELKNYKEDLPIYALKEGEFVVINK